MSAAGTAERWGWPGRLLGIICTTIGVALTLAGEVAAGEPVYPGCQAPPERFANIYYVDPHATGGRGTAAAPLAFSDALHLARGGDEILLRSGDYGDVDIRGANATYVVIAGAPGQKPVFTSLTIGNTNSTFWAVEGVTIVGRRQRGLWHPGAWQSHLPEVKAQGDNLYFARNTIATREGDFPWRREIQGVVDSDPLADGIHVTNSSCVTLSSNHIYNIFNGIMIGGDLEGQNGKKALLYDNVINDFAGDGIDHFGSDILISHNLIRDGRDICSNLCVHQDGIQGWTYNGRPLLNENVRIEGNTVVVRTRPDNVLSSDSLQGITIFDGDWTNVHIVNNVVIVDSWHGISLYGAIHSRIINNTVLGVDPSRQAWILVKSKKGVVPGSGIVDVLVRNNLTPTVALGERTSGLPGAKADHNVFFDNPRRFFAKVDAHLGAFDLHLSRSSPARGAGSPDGAPPVDLDGVPRGPVVDAGAYQAR